MTAGKTSYPMREWPESDRPREKLLSLGPEYLSDAELLAIVLRTGDGSSRRSALDYSRQLMGMFKTFHALSMADADTLRSLKGIGPAKTAAVKAVMEIARRYATQRLEAGHVLASSSDVFRHFHQRLKDKKREAFYIVLLDNKNRVIKEDRISEGTLTSSLVHPREVFASAVRAAAASLVVVHNHPSGDPTPSREDEQITGRLTEAGKVLGIHMVDHVIIGGEKYYSFADQGRL